MNRNSGLQSLVSSIRRSAARWALAALLSSAAVWGATFGTVVPLDIPIGGHVSDVLLDEPRGVLYAANFTARRIAVISLADRKATRKIDVPAQPGSMALSPDGAWLVVTHFGGDPGFVLDKAPAANCPSGGVSVIRPATGLISLTACANFPVAAAFGADGLALIATVDELLLLDPVSGAVQSLGQLRCGKTINGVDALICGLTKGLPVPLDNFPAQISSASITASQDGFTIYGQLKTSQNTTTSPISADVLRFRYDVAGKNVVWLPAGSTPGSGPNTVSVNRDGSRFMAGWGLLDRNGSVVAQFHNPTATDNIGSHAIDTVGNANYPYGIIYAQVPDGSGAATCPTSFSYCPGPVTATGAPVGNLPVPEPVLMLVDADNLTVHERIFLPENLAGRSVLNAKRDVMYSASDSGVLILPVGSLASQPRLAVSKEDIVFRPDQCKSGLGSQTIDIVNPGGGKVGFVIVPTNAGINVSPKSGITPARVTVSIDPGSFQQQNGTTTASLQIFSLEAVNIPDPVRVLINNRGADQRGTFLTVPGTLVDLLADPSRDRFYVLRQRKNDVLVYDSKNNNLLAAMRTSATPTQMTLTMDRKYLLVGHEDSQFAYVYDLDTLQPVPADLHILFPAGHYPKSISATNTSILAASRKNIPFSAMSTSTDGRHIQIDAVDFPARTGWTLPSLGIYRNFPTCATAAGECPYNTVLAPSPDGRLSFAALSDGNVFLYSDALHTFTTSRKLDVAFLSGAYAASNNGQYVAGNNLLNSSLVPVKALDSGVNPTSGFVFVNNAAFRTTAQATALPPPPTSRTECVFGGTICVTQMLPGTGISTYPPGAITPGSIQTVTSLGPDKFDPSLSDSVRPVRLPESPLAATPDAVFTRTLAAVRDQSALVLMTQSGLTVMPWSYDAPIPIPQLDRVVSSADQTRAVASGGLITLIGRGMPMALGDACLTVNGAGAPLLQSVSSTQINAQLPFDANGNAQLTLYTQGGASDNLNVTILPTAPSVFRASGELAGAGAMVYRASNNSLVSPLNPVQAGDDLVIFATGLGRTTPAIRAGEAAPADPLASAVVQPDVSLDGLPLAVDYAGLTPGGIGVYQINVKVPSGVGEGQNVPLTIRQGGMSTTVAVQVAVQ